MKINNKKIACVLLAVFLVMTLSAGCAQEEIPVEVPIPAPTPTIQISTPTPKPTPTPTPTVTPIPTPAVYSIREGYSPTTGLKWEGEYKPIAVIIENHIAARPQSGLSKADWVYEIYVEGLITRFIAIFNDNYPEKVGPVRSIRYNHLDIQQEWNAALVHFGASNCPSKYCVINIISKFDFPFRADGHKGKNDEYFWRSDDRRAPHNAYNDLTKTSQMFEADISPVLHNFCEALMSGGSDCSELIVAYNSSHSYTEYKYNPESNSYLRFVSGEEFVEKETGEQIEVKNIIIQRTDHFTVKVGPTYQIMKLVGEGEAEFIMGGKHFSGTWKSDSVKGKTFFYLENGQEITLLPGNTWVQIVYNDTEITVIK